MKPFIKHDGLVAPMDRANVDTDLMVPKQFLKSIRRSGFGPNLFDELRYLDEGQPDSDNSQRPLNPEFPLNFPRYQGASILLARENFGCGLGDGRFRIQVGDSAEFCRYLSIERAEERHSPDCTSGGPGGYLVCRRARSGGLSTGH